MFLRLRNKEEIPVLHSFYLYQQSVFYPTFPYQHIWIFFFTKRLINATVNFKNSQGNMFSYSVMRTTEYLSNLM